MKRICFCAALFVAVVIYSVISHVYVSNTVKGTAVLLVKANDSRKSGDHTSSREYVDAAWEKWHGFSVRGAYVLADVTIAVDVTVSLARVVSLSRTDDDDRFNEECIATILMLEHFLGDNKNLLDGMA